MPRSPPPPPPPFGALVFSTLGYALDKAPRGQPTTQSLAPHWFVIVDPLSFGLFPHSPLLPIASKTTLSLTRDYEATCRAPVFSIFPFFFQLVRKRPGFVMGILECVVSSGLNWYRRYFFVLCRTQRPLCLGFGARPRFLSGGNWRSLSLP